MRHCAYDGYSGTLLFCFFVFFFSSRRRHTRCLSDWSSDVCSSDLFERFPKAVKFKDFRQMLDKQGKDIDAVVVGPPDHMHTICAMACMQHGKHVYVEKPLTRLSGEARLLAQAAEKYKVATQMGNQ